jgi:hypothetical protein
VWFVGTGETADFELTPDRADAFALEAFTIDPVRKVQMVYVRVPIHVVPAAAVGGARQSGVENRGTR